MSARSIVVPVLLASATAAIWSIMYNRLSNEHTSRGARPEQKRRGIRARQHALATPTDDEQRFELSPLDDPSLPTEVTLTKAFWDSSAPDEPASFVGSTESDTFEAALEDAALAAQDDENAAPTSRFSLDARDGDYALLEEDELTAAWLARATQTSDLPNVDIHTEDDDPAEVAADSLSMVSEASRAMASIDLAEEADSLDDDPK
jgi:hypothetical protein